MPHPTGSVWYKSHYKAICEANKARIGKPRRFSKKRSKTVKRLWKTKAYGGKLRKIHKTRMADPVKKAEWLAAIISPAARKKQASSMREFWADEDNYARMCQVRKDQVTDEARANLSAEQNRRWGDPDYRRKMVRKRKKQATPERNAANSARMSDLWQDPEYRKKQAAGRKDMYSDSERLAKISATAKASYKSGKRVIWNKGLTKDTDPRVMQISLTQRGRVPKYGKWKCWYPSIKQKEICMRSSWELAFASWLDDCDIRWEYELSSFHVGKGIWKGWTYTPDFYLPDQNEYVEIKGHLTQVDAAKMKRFHKLYPDVVLHLLDGKCLKDIRHRYGAW